MVAMSTARLLDLARKAYRKGRLVEEKDGSHPTRGVVIPIVDLVRWGTKAGKASAIRKYDDSAG